MGNFSAKCSKCEREKSNYELKSLGFEIDKNNYFPFFYTRQVPHQTMYIYKYKCSNGHVFNSTLGLC